MKSHAHLLLPPILLPPHFMQLLLMFITFLLSPSAFLFAHQALLPQFEFFCHLSLLQKCCKGSRCWIWLSLYCSNQLVLSYPGLTGCRRCGNGTSTIIRSCRLSFSSWYHCGRWAVWNCYCFFIFQLLLLHHITSSIGSLSSKNSVTPASETPAFTLITSLISFAIATRGGMAGSGLLIGKVAKLPMNWLCSPRAVGELNPM